MKDLSGVEELLEAGYYPSLSVRCYQVNYTQGSRRTLTRYSAGDIPSQYIDMDSIHAEWTYSPNDRFEPGGCIPVSLSFRLIPGSNVSIETVLYPKSAADYSYLYHPVITFRTFKTTPTTTYLPFPYMVLREQSRSKGDDQTKKLYFEDETCMFDYVEVDVASMYGNSYNSILYNILNTVGLADQHNTGIIGSTSLTGTSYYQGEPMSARQFLSYIGEANGIFYQLNNNSMLRIREMLTAEDSQDSSSHYVYDGEVKWQYFMDRNTEEVWPSGYVWQDVVVIPYGAERKTGNFPEKFYLYDNPFVVSENQNTYRALLMERMIKFLLYSGEEILCRYDPRFEIGDYISVRFKLKEGGIGGVPMTICRISWDGSAFFTLKGPSFARYNRI